MIVMRRVPMLSAAMLMAVLIGVPCAVRAQVPDVRDELLMQFDMSMQKFIALAQAMPADRFTWAPGDGVMQVGQVFMHVAHYNYMYPSANMGVAAPESVDMETMEEVRDKALVIDALQQSQQYVKDAVTAMSTDDLVRQTRLYGRDVRNWAVLVQLVAHMNEHLGQSIAYARVNGIVPPWSR